MTTPHHDDIERQLVSELRREAELAMALTDTPKELKRFQQRMHVNKRRSRLVAVAAALAVVAGGIGVAVAVGRSGGEGRQRIVPAPGGGRHTTPTTTTQQWPNPSTVPSAEVTKLEGPVSVGVAALGAVWATSLEGRGLLHRVALDGSRSSTTPLDGVNDSNPGPFQVGSAILVANARGDGYAVFDASGKRRGTIPVQAAAYGTGDATGGWIQTSPTSIGRVDASGSRILRSITIPDIDVGGIAAADGVLWVIDRSVSRVLRVDPQTGRITGAVSVPSSLLQVVATRGGVFVASEDYTVRRIDPAQLRVTALLQGQSGWSWPILTVAANGDLWVEPAKGAMAKVDTDTLHPDRFVTLFRNDRAGGNYGIAVTADRAFITDGDSRTLYSFPLS